MSAVPDDHEFALLLTHDVDRPYKTYQSLYYALQNREPKQLLEFLYGENPFWTFDALRDLEDDLGVRSAFYFMDERSLTDLPVWQWFDPESWRLFAGRYSLNDHDIVALIRSLAADDWEIGLHGSYHSYRDRHRLEREKLRLESILDRPVLGGRQHYLNLDEPATWEHQRAVGLRYDGTPGSSTTFGFDGEYGIRRPFDDEFVVFPLTVMETTLPDPDERFDRAWTALEGLLDEAAANDAVMNVLWHPRFFAGEDFPGHVRLYRQLVETALDMGAWVGPPGRLYEQLEWPEATSNARPSRRGVTGR
ncbi:polysaccharide deacetylase family protein [Haloarchaeobius litoreus]|uniref:Polysaccharide deacetylase family protein n=1 Tax=Haloarchaeobius litoreus TaxID=755306 RepID=A0ABD6DNU3_9EURY|nr:polysaccharide deacetylase family protein [Haloarchaeobius litoreus]